MQKNTLSLKRSKTEIMLIGKTVNHDLLSTWLSSMGKCPLPVKTLRNLGSTFDQELTWVPLLKNGVKNTSYYQRMLRKIKHLLCQKHRQILVQALVQSRLDLNNIVYLGLPAKWTRKIQLIENQEARLLTRESRRSHITPVLRALH